MKEKPCTCLRVCVSARELCEQEPGPILRETGCVFKGEALGDGEQDSHTSCKWTAG